MEAIVITHRKTLKTARRFAATATAILVCAAHVASGACGLEVLELDDEPKAKVPEAVQEVFDRNCGNAGCHGSAPAEGLSLLAGDSNDIIGGPSEQSDLPMVEIGSIEGSYLAIKLLPDDGLPEGVEREGRQMPLTPLAEPTDMAVILGWIAGAPVRFHRRLAEPH